MSSRLDIYVIEDDDGKMEAGSKSDIDGFLDHAEQYDDGQIDFKTIAKIKAQHANIDFSKDKIEFFEKGDKDEIYINKVVLAIVKYLS